MDPVHAALEKGLDDNYYFNEGVVDQSANYFFFFIYLLDQKLRILSPDSFYK